jgi:polyphosphate kinase
VIDRFLEHARIFYFENEGRGEVFCSSADWMPRNFRRRVEIMFPVLEEDLKTRLKKDILDVMAADNKKAWLLHADGRYRRVEPGKNAAAVRSQMVFIAQAKARAQAASPALRAQEVRQPGDESPLGKLRRRHKKSKK